MGIVWGRCDGAAGRCGGDFGTGLLVLGRTGFYKFYRSKASPVGFPCVVSRGVDVVMNGLPASLSRAGDISVCDGAVFCAVPVQGLDPAGESGDHPQASDW